MKRTLLTVVEEDGKLFVFDGDETKAPPLVQYSRTRPADPARPGSQDDELVTDVTAVVRMAVRTMVRIDPERSKF